MKVRETQQAPVVVGSLGRCQLLFLCYNWITQPQSCVGWSGCTFITTSHLHLSSALRPWEVGSGPSRRTGGKQAAAALRCIDSEGYSLMKLSQLNETLLQLTSMDTANSPNHFSVSSTQVDVVNHLCNLCALPSEPDHWWLLWSPLWPSMIWPGLVEQMWQKGRRSTAVPMVQYPFAWRIKTPSGDEQYSLSRSRASLWYLWKFPTILMPQPSSSSFYPLSSARVVCFLSLAHGFDNVLTSF